MKKFLQHQKLLLAVLLAGCICYMCASAAATPKQAPPMKSQEAGWIVYWDWQEGARQAAQDEGALYVAFAAYFDRDGRLLLPEPLAAQDFGGLDKKKMFLSFVNDRQLENGKFSQKETAFLRQLLDKRQLRRQHVKDVAALCRENGFAGIEIDYENIWQEKKLVEDFARFIRELRQEAEAEGLALRVVLEPKTLAFAELLPKNVEYVVMFYNLYGLHSGPGPKADRRFILRTLKQLEKLKGTPNIAFANGGFDWRTDGRIVGLTSQAAAALAAARDAELKRDDSSRALNFSYDEDGITHTVWYADGQTLEYWRSIAMEYGYKRFSLWRLDGGSKP